MEHPVPLHSREHDDDFIEVKGRRWRSTDPNIPPDVRAELVSELLAARTAFSGSARDSDRSRDARSRIDAAEIALGERGDPWSDDPFDLPSRTRVIAIIRTLLTIRSDQVGVELTDVARVLSGDGWRGRLWFVEEVVRERAADGVYVVDEAAPDDLIPRSAGIRIRRGPSFT